MTQVFISYERSNETNARQIADALSTAGFDTRCDALLPPHRGWRLVDETGTVSLNFIWMPTVLGMREEAYRLIDAASFAHLFEPSSVILGRDYGLHAIFDASLRELRRDRRFVGLCRKLGLCDYWLATNRWPDCAAEAAPHYDFKEVVRQRAPPLTADLR